MPGILQHIQTGKSETFMTKIDEKIKNSKIVYILLILLSAGLIILNFLRCLEGTFWGDEAYSINLTRMSWGDMFGQIAYDVQTPFFYVVLRIIYMIFGDMRVAYHFAAFLPYILLQVVILTLVKKEFGNVTAGFMIVFTSLTTASMGYMTEIRMYELCTFLVFMSFLFAYKIFKAGGRKNWICFSVFSLMAAYSQTYALIAVACLYAVIIMGAIFRKELRLGAILICVAAVICYMPWLLVLFSQFGAASSDWWQTEIPTSKSLFLSQYDYGWMAIVVIAILGAFIATMFIDKKIFSEGKVKKQFSMDVMTFILALAPVLGVAVVGVGISHLVRPLFLDKYYYVVAATSYFLVAYMLSKVRFGSCVAVGLAVVFLLLGAKNFKHEYSAMKYIDNGNTDFLENVQLDEDDVTFSNSDHYHWAILPYYYEKAEHRNAQDAYDFSGTEGKNIWLVWSSPIDEANILELKEQGLSVREFYSGNIGNALTVYVYKTIRE